MIDLHAHILPEVDDGPDSIDAAVEMARVAVAAGTRSLATTSHIAHFFGVGPDELEAAREALRARLAAEGIALELLAGGEIEPARVPDLEDEELRRLTLGGGPYLLLECPFSPVGDAMQPIVEDLHQRGFAVLLAHPERSASFERKPARLARLVERGALAQITVRSLSGALGDAPRRAAARMLEQGLVHVLASDAHDPVERPPTLEVTGLDDDQVAWMTSAAPAAIVAGRPLPERPPLPATRRVPA